MSPGVRPASLPTPPPRLDPETQPYWDAAARGELVLPLCPRCDRLFWYPRGACPRCGATDLSWRPASGEGVVYSFSVVRRAGGAWAQAVPYVLAYVTLAEGLTVAANIVGCAPEEITVDLPVHAVFEAAAAGDPAILRFTPAAAG
ncbi:hypothetical protein FSW04_01995 [Baekduia soli]|uniref:Zn-ribbon domain-containing OB-fold protein n=1 Tax=Baekduia soli TaxID=496014 RepID=A0A5B8U0H8_9ACTN|nr:OB-fold domain-containing protein [Baekduia soli]QEC46471.1 hypothetical protein FSW04_01995 [Baekduia soli]